MKMNPKNRRTSNGMSFHHAISLDMGNDGLLSKKWHDFIVSSYYYIRMNLRGILGEFLTALNTED